MALTKIIATIGPAVEKEKQIVSLLESGANVFRFNLKHNSANWHREMIDKVKRAGRKTGKAAGILLDFPNLEKKLSINPEHLSIAKEKNVDFLALSFVRGKQDIDFLKRGAKRFSLSAKILAKIEAKEALDNFEQILDSCFGIMVARGDLGKEIPFEKVPYYQKKIIRRCLEKGKPVIVATQMLRSMVENPLPTRAEVSDVANAILDYTDAVMLSEETALGRYPSRAVSTMEKICRFWEKKREPVSGLNFELQHQTAAVCHSAYQLWRSPFCQRQNVRAFVVLTKTGMTARMLSRFRPTIPIFAFAPQVHLRDQFSLIYGTYSFSFGKEKDFYRKKTFSDIKKILRTAKKVGGFKKGERVIIIFAEDWHGFGKANVVRIQEIF